MTPTTDGDAAPEEEFDVAALMEQLQAAAQQGSNGEVIFRQAATILETISRGAMEVRYLSVLALRAEKGLSVIGPEEWDEDFAGESGVIHTGYHAGESQVAAALMDALTRAEVEEATHRAEDFSVQTVSDTPESLDS